MKVLTITKDEIHQKLFPNKSRSWFSNYINSILPAETKKSKTLFPKDLKILLDELGIEDF